MYYVLVQVWLSEQKSAWFVQTEINFIVPAYSYINNYV